MPYFSHARRFVIVSAFFLWAVLAFPFTDAFADEVHITVIQSSNVQGHLFPCPA
jgi:hypothetical protein